MTELPELSSDLGPVENERPAANPATSVECWRCGKPNGSSVMRCVFCHAPLNDEVVANMTSAPQAAGDSSRALAKLLIAYGCLFASSIAARLYFMSSDANSDDELPITMVLEIIDTVIVLLATVSVAQHVRLRLPQPRLPSGRVLVLSLVGLTIALGIVLICIQPAVVEELFFRYLCFEVLRDYASGRVIVFLTALMFGLAHVGTPLSIPLLILLGILFGYARLHGGMALCILLHALHNFFVFMSEIVTS